MRLIHFSDTHLGFAESSKVDPKTLMNVREQDTYAAFNAVIDAAVRLKPELVIHAGDLFHSPRPSNRAIVTAIVGFQRLSLAGIPLVVVAGNHSVPRGAGVGTIFEVWKVLPGIYSVHRGKYEIVEIGDAAVHCVPHVHTDEALKVALDAIQPLPNRRFNLLVMHGAVRGSAEKSSLVEFNEVGVGREHLGRFAGFDYVALGHYHRSCKVAPKVRYSGSTERFHVDEAGYEKGFLEVDLASGKVKFHALAPREIALVSLQCGERRLAEIIEAARQGLRKHAVAEGAIIVVRPQEIDPVIWAELRRERHALERDCVPDAFEVRWEPSFADQELARRGGPHIGAIGEEFGVFMKTAKVHDRDRRRLLRLGEEYLQRAVGLEDEE